MADYTELVKALRHCGQDGRCSECPMFNHNIKCVPDMANAAADAIEELQSVVEHYVEVCSTEIQRWIPVTERLPEHEYGEGESVLTVDLFGVMRVVYFDGGNWCRPTGETLTTMRVAPITHWMPLPQPPKEETE